nr:hypothetical protein DK37_28070 [Halomonas sp. SUBG004]
MIKEQSLENYRLQSNDLETLVQMATFDRQLGDLHQRMSEVFSRAEATDLGTMQRYAEYGRINQELSRIGESVDRLSNSPLILDLSQESAATLQRAFYEYRRFVNMANEAATLNQGDPVFICKKPNVISRRSTSFLSKFSRRLPIAPVTDTESLTPISTSRATPRYG